MPSIRALGGIALVTAMLVGCDTVKPMSSTSPVGLTQGTVQEQLRQQQLSNAAQNPGTRNPVASGANVGVGGIERSGAGAGSVAAGAPTAINPGVSGISRGEGVGAPDTQAPPPARPKKKKTTKPATTN